MKISKEKNAELKTEIASGFLGGLNTFQDETLIKENELTEAKNIILTVDGIEPRHGTTNFGSESGTKVLGAFSYYQEDGTRELLRIATGANDKLQKYDSSNAPTDIGSQTYSTASDSYTNFVQADDKVYVFNGVDNLSYYDGSTITTYTSISTPTSVSVTPQGTAGTTTYSYRISAVNDVGETLASSAVNTTTGTASLNSTNFNEVTWTAVAGANAYNVYGRSATGKQESYMTTVDTNLFQDKGSSDYEPSLSIYPPDGNSTLGVKAKYPIFAISRMFAAGDPDFPSRLYFSGAGEKITDWSATTYAGGYLDVYAKDGAEIRGIYPFQGGVIVFKDNAIYKFYFDATTGAQTLQEITRSFGGISHRGIMAVENDLIFPAKKDGRLAFYSLGNQENFASTVLRTNELSIKISEKLTDVNPSRLQYSAGFYFNNIYGCAVAKSNSSVNNRVWKLDTRFGAWTYDEGYTPNQFLTWIDSSDNEKLYYTDEASGYLVEMFTSARNDNGTAISVEWATKSFNQKAFQKYKQYFFPTLQFKNISVPGALSGYIYMDGAILTGQFTVNQQSLGGAGVGVYFPGFALPGDGGGGTVVTGVSSDVLQEIYLRSEPRRSIKYTFQSSSVNAKYKFLSLSHDYMILDSKPLPDTTRTYLTS